MHELNEFLAHLAVDGTAGEEMLGTMFRWFRKDDRASVADHEIARDTKGRVGRDAGIAIRATALQGNLQVVSQGQAGG